MSKRNILLMFLAFFPFSEIVCLISVIMAWLYIGLGLLGNHHLPDTTNGKNLSFGNEIQSANPSVSKAENWFWFENKIIPDADYTALLKNYLSFIPVIHRENADYQISIKLVYLIEYKSKRAPPLVS